MTSFHVTTKPAGGVCNLDCTYCFYLDKVDLYDGPFRMSDEVLEAYVRGMLDAQPGQEVVFTFQGGEPTLLGVDYYRRVIELQHRFRRPGQLVRNTIQTNGTLIDEDWAAFLVEHEFLVGISIDGPRDLHDAFRHTKAGTGTYDDVVRGLRTLQRHGVEVNALTTVNSVNVHRPIEVYRHLTADLGLTFIQFIPIVERAQGDTVTIETPPADAYGRFLNAVFDEWVRTDVGQVFVREFDNALSIRHGLGSTICIHAEVCGAAVALEHTGDLYSCDHFVDPDHLIGSIVDTPIGDLVGSPGQRAFGAAKRTTLTAQCRECDVLSYCGGGCPKDRFTATTSGEPGLHYLCEGYLSFFRHIDPVMERMSELLGEGRPPAEVMGRPSHLPDRVAIPAPPPLPTQAELIAGWTSLGMPRVRRRIDG